MQPARHHLAELNFGTLRYDWDDPRVRDFVDGPDLVNSLAERSPGFVWRLTDDAMAVEQTGPNGAFGVNPRVASTLSVWVDAGALARFVWNTVHKQFYARRAEWYDAVGNSNLVLWWVPEGHRPSMAEGLSRHRQLLTHGPSETAFGWDWVKPAATSDEAT